MRARPARASDTMSSGMARKAHSCGCGNAICVCSLPRVGLGNGQLKRPLDGMPSAPLARLDNLPAPLARAPSLSQRLLARTSSGGALAAGGSDGPPLPPPPLPASKFARQDGGPRPTTFFDVATRLPVLSDAEQAAQATMHAVRACTLLPSRLPRLRRCGRGCRLGVFQGGAHRRDSRFCRRPRRRFPPRCRSSATSPSAPTRRRSRARPASRKPPRQPLPPLRRRTPPRQLRPPPRRRRGMRCPGTGRSKRRRGSRPTCRSTGQRRCMPSAPLQDLPPSSGARRPAARRSTSRARCSPGAPHDTCAGVASS